MQAERQAGPGVHASRRVCSWGNLKFLAKAELISSKPPPPTTKKEHTILVSSIGVLSKPEQRIGPQR